MRLRILLMARTNNHTTAKEAGRWRLGEIVDVFQATERAGPDGSKAFFRVYVTDWADTLQAAKDEFLAPHENTKDATLVARRKKVFDLSSTVDRRGLMDTGYLELTTAKLRSLLLERDTDTRIIKTLASDEPVETVAKTVDGKPVREIKTR